MITIVSNNYAGESGLRTCWGFAAVVETPSGPVLFDTGADGEVLLENMAALGIDPAGVAAAAFSHEHGDHTGGLGEFLPASRSECRFFMAEAFPSALKDAVRAAGRELVETSAPTPAAEGVTTTAVLEGTSQGASVAEQALAIDAPSGLVVVTGCAHPGVVAMARAAAEATGRRPAVVIGGFHMPDWTDEEIRAASEELRGLGVERLGATHCTGDRARAILAEEWGDDFLNADLGQRLDVGL